MVLDLTNHGFILSVLDVSGAAPRSAIFPAPERCRCGVNGSRYFGVIAVGGSAWPTPAR